MQRSWTIRPIDEPLLERLKGALDLPPLLADLLIRRGIATAHEADRFLCSDLSHLSDPSHLEDLKKAVSIIRQGISAGQRFLVVGDYDVDGLTGTALLYRVLRETGASVSTHIPHRMEEGYGLKTPVIQEAAREGIRVLIAVDCGTTAFEELELARRLGMETIVVDHHDFDPRGKPAASALLNPLSPEGRYPCQDLASVGVAFTLARGLVGPNFLKAWEHLDLVALGTIADFSPLTGENRILAKAGLHRLRGTNKAGLCALLSSVKLGGEDLTSEDVSFTLAPRLNAMGRMGSAESSLRLLITDDLGEAQRLANDLERQNRNRVAREREALRRALTKVMREVNFAKDRVIVLEDEQWHPGVIGIIASRLVNRFHRPAVMIALEGSLGRGSARSIPAFHLMEALEEVKDHLIAFGGHPAAAGLTIARGKVASFRQAINRIFLERVDSRKLIPVLEVDGELPLDDLTEELLRDLETMAPFGAGNPRPVFTSSHAWLPESPATASFDPRGVRLIVKDGQGRAFEAIHSRHEAWEGGSLRRIRGGRRIQIAYSPVRRRGVGSAIELRLRDMKPFI